MNNKFSYERIKDSIVYSFEEYVGEDGFTVSQSAAKTFEEEWRRLNYNMFTKTAYYICVAIECFNRKEIPDFIYDKLKFYINSNVNEFKDNTNDEEIEQLLQDINKCIKLMKNKNYKVIESRYGAKSRIEYILSMKP